MPAPLPPALLWIDPGKMTGLASLTTETQFHNLAFIADEFDFQGAGYMIEGMCVYWKRKIAVGWERFTITPNTHKKTRQPEAMEVIGVARYICGKYGCQVLEPAQQHTPDASDQARLRALGWWKPGKDDAQSAAAHMLNYLLRTGTLPAREAAILRQLREQGDGREHG